MSKRRRAKQEQRTYTDSYVSSLLATATGEAQLAATAAKEVCAGLYSRAFMSARVEPDTPETRALTVEALGLIGRSFITRGESLFCIEADPADGTVKLLPSSSWTVKGSLDPETWSYVANLTGPEYQRLAHRIRGKRTPFQDQCKSRISVAWTSLPWISRTTTSKIDQGDHSAACRRDRQVERICRVCSSRSE